MSHEFNRQLAFGKIGEAYIATWLKMSCRYHVLPVYEKEMQEGKGPVLFPTQGETLIAPDLLAFRREGEHLAKIRWVEAKTKSAFSWHRITQRWVTGIDLHHYTQYQKVADISPWPVWLLFLHYEGRAKDSPAGCPTGLFGGDIRHLTKNENHRSPNWGKSGMVYWAHSTLRPLATLEQVFRAMEDHQTRQRTIAQPVPAPAKTDKAA